MSNKDNIRAYLNKEAGTRSYRGLKQGASSAWNALRSGLSGKAMAQTIDPNVRVSPSSLNKPDLAAFLTGKHVGKNKKLITGGGAAVGGAHLGSNVLDANNPIYSQPISAAELLAARGRGAARAKQPTEIPAEATAGVGGALAGGAAGYALSDKLGIDKLTGTLGGAALSAVSAALIAHKLKQS